MRKADACKERSGIRERSAAVDSVVCASQVTLFAVDTRGRCGWGEQSSKEGRKEMKAASKVMRPPSDSICHSRCGVAKPVQAACGGGVWR